MDDPHDLQRFVDAQDSVYERVLAELAAGQKTTHWMWFVFPQLKGLGRTATAQHFGLASLEEASAFARHPVLGPRLQECTARMLAIKGRSALQVLGPPDDLKFCSSMTLFEKAWPAEPAFAQALVQYFDGERDPRTLSLLKG